MSVNVYEKRVQEIVSKDIVSLDVRDTVRVALELMGENRVSTLPVVDNHDRCVGILSAADLVDLTRDADEDIRELDWSDLSSKVLLMDKLSLNLGNEPIQNFMSESIVTVTLETPIGRAAQEMLRNQIHHLPVVDKDSKLLGIVSTMDLLGAFADAAPD